MRVAANSWRSRNAASFRRDAVIEDDDNLLRIPNPLDADFEEALAHEIGVLMAHGEIDGCHDHYDLLRTIEENFGLRTLGGEDERSDPIVEGVWREAPR